MAKKEVALRGSNSQVERARSITEGALPALPEELAATVDLRGWIKALLLGEEYTEPDPGYLSREMALNILLSPGEPLTEDIDGLAHLQDIVPEYAGASTGPIRITDLYVVPSSIEEGVNCYLILTWVSMEDNIVTRCSGGSQSVQINLIKCLMAGMWPIDCEIYRTDTKLKGGKFMLSVGPVR